MIAINPLQCIFWSRINLDHSLNKSLQLNFLWLYSLLVAFMLAIEVASLIYIIHHKILVVLAMTSNKYKKITKTLKNAIAPINIDETFKPTIFCCDTSYLHISPKPCQGHGFPKMHIATLVSLSIIVYLCKFFKLNILYSTLPSFPSNGRQQI